MNNEINFPTMKPEKQAGRSAGEEKIDADSAKAPADLAKSPAPTASPAGCMRLEGKPKNGDKPAKESAILRDDALALLKKYNKDAFHIRHGLTVEAVMRWFAKDLGHESEEDFWGIVGLLHDIDFEMWPDQHCQKAVDLLKDAGVSDDMIKAIVSHGYCLCSDEKPTLEMEKVLYACDELTGLIWSAALMRPSKSCKDMELSSLKKKFKDKKFAAGCNRDIIKAGADLLGWELDQLLEKTLSAMKDCEDAVNVG